MQGVKKTQHNLDGGQKVGETLQIVKFADVVSEGARSGRHSYQLSSDHP